MAATRVDLALNRDQEPVQWQQGTKLTLVVPMLNGDGTLLTKATMDAGTLAVDAKANAGAGADLTGLTLESVSDGKARLTLPASAATGGNVGVANVNLVFNTEVVLAGKIEITAADT